MVDFLLLTLFNVAIVGAEDLLRNLVLDNRGFLLFLLELALEQAGVAVVEEVFQVVLLLGELLGDDASDASDGRVVMGLHGLQLPKRTIDGMRELRVRFGWIVRVIAQVVLELGVWGVGVTVDHEGGGRMGFEKVVYERNDCHNGGWRCEET